MDYELAVPPFEMVPIHDMKKKQVEQYFNWKMSIKEERIGILQKYVQRECPDIILDKTPESLIPLWGWFENHIEWEERTQEEIEEDINSRPDWMRPFVLQHTKKITILTMALASDIATYFGETMIANNSNIYWGYLMKPKKLDGVNRPLLLGFQGDLNTFPYSMVEVCIDRSTKNRNNHELYETYTIWKQYA